LRLNLFTSNFCTACLVVVVRRVCLDPWRSYGGYSRQV
jgi:hypothetical protein